MKKIKIALITIAIVSAIGGAFATRVPAKAPCEFMPQYRLYNGSYVPAGQYGVDYLCTGGSLDVCTWYKPWPASDWTPCKQGTYLPLDE